MFDTADAEPLMKEVILPKVQKFLNNATVLLKYAERETQPNPTGEFIITYNKGQNNNAGAGRIEDETLPDAYPSAYGRSTVGSKLIYTRAKWTGKVIEATQSKESMINALVDEVQQATIATKDSVNRQLNGDERDALGFYVSGAGGTAVVVTDEFGNLSGDYFRSGTTYVDLIDGSNNTVRQSGITVTRGAVGATGRALTAGANLDAGATAGDYFVLNGTLVAAVPRQLHGIRSVIAAGNPPLESATGLQGVPVATVPEFAATVIGSDAAEVDLQFHNMQRVLSDIDVNSDVGQAGVKFILTSQPGYDTYAKLAKDEKITVNEMELDGGFTGISFNGRLPIVADKHTRRGAYFFINPSSVKLYQLADFKWMDRMGSMFYILSGGDKDGYGANLYAYMEFGTHLRNANGALVGQNMLY